MTPARVMAAWSLLGCACAPDDAQRYELPGLTVIEDFDEPICAGTFPYFQRRLRWLEQETGLPRDPRGLTYRWYLDQTQVEEACSFSLGGCAKGRTFFGNVIVFSHELVHAHLSRLGRPRVWLEEGMAVMLEDERSGAPHPLFTPSVLMRIDKALEIDYPAASAFTTYLRDRYGMASLLDYYEASSDTDAAMSLAIFEEVFGDTFADVEADYLDGGLPDTSGSLDCDGPDVAWGSERWEHTFRLACEEPGSIGPDQIDSDGGPFLWSKVTMTAPAGWISLELDTSGPAWVSLLSCEGLETVHVAADQPHAQAYIAGGRYLVYINASLDEAPVARVTARHLTAAPTLEKLRTGQGSLSHGARRSRACGGAAGWTEPN